MAEILHQLIIKVPPLRVYQALTEQKAITGWWTQYARCEPRVDSVAEFEFDSGKLKLRMKIVKLLPQRTVVWHCLAGPEEWVGTQISFELQLADKNTILNFAHRGWKSSLYTLPFYNFEWARQLMSLRAYLEKGKGYPYRK